MPIVIGAKPEQFRRSNRPVERLPPAHRAVSVQCYLLVNDGARGGPLNDEQRTAVETALLYFREAAPRHTADEEQSLFPRLRERGLPEAQAMLARVDALEQDHACADESHAEVDRLGRAWLTSGELSASDAARLSALLQGLTDLYRHHIAVEEDEVFPFAARSLSGPEREAMGGEMAARRGLSRIRCLRRSRRQSLIFPREHGAWGILLVPLFTGASVGLLAGGRAWPLAPLSIAVLALFWLRTPVESWIGTGPVRARTPGELELVRSTAFALAAISAAALLWLFWGGRNRALLWIGATAVTAFIVQAIVRQAWRSARMAAQMIGAAGLTAVAPAAYYVVTGHLNGADWYLWMANFLFAANQIQFVQLRIRAAHAMKPNEKLSIGRWFVAGQVLLMVLLALACADHLFRWYSAIAFLPVLFRGFAWFVAASEPLAIHALGKRELIHAGVFGVLLVLGLQLP